MSAEPKRLYTLEEYLALDKSSEEKLEFWNGEIFSMSGGSRKHAEIAANLVRLVGNHLVGRECRALGSDMRVKITGYAPYCYPDVTVYCGKPEVEELDGQEMLLNPTLIFEVLSKTTAALDHGEKFIALKAINGFFEYILIDQYKPLVTQYIRQADNKWQRTDIVGLDGSLRLSSIDCALKLTEIYDGIEI